MTKTKRMRFSSKLFLCTTPLIFFAFFLVALLAYKVSADTVTDVSRSKLMLEAESCAEKMETVFKMCAKDLDLLRQFFFEQFFNSQDPANFGADFHKLVPALQKFRLSSPLYLQVGFWDINGNLVLTSDPNGLGDLLTTEDRRNILAYDLLIDPILSYQAAPVSRLVYSPRLQNYIVTMYRVIYDNFGNLMGLLMVDIDFNQLVNMVEPSSRQAQNSFAFIVDRNGETVFHPNHDPYSSRFTQYRDPAMREFIIYTILGLSGLKVYKANDSSEERMAAYAPVPSADWALVKTVPLAKFTESAVMLRTYIIQIGVFILVVTAAILYLLAYKLNQPILHLAKVTRQLASGNLDVAYVKIAGSAEVAQLTKDFNLMAANLKHIQEELIVAEKLSSLGRLSAGVAHELRNPLNAIKLTFLYLERHRLDEAAFSKASALIYQEIERLNKFVNNFLYFATESPPVKTECDIMDILNNVLFLNQNQSRENNIQVSVTCNGPVPLLFIDEHQLVQVFLNLYNNAVQAMPNGGRLNITLIHDLDKKGRFGIKIIFCDEGCGIKTKVLNKIFDPFFTTKKRGTGLGLAITRAIIEGHNGTIAIKNRSDSKGTQVEIFIPVNGQ